MKVLNREFHALKSGHTFAVITLRGKRGEEVNIVAEGMRGEVIFFSEAPKTNYAGLKLTVQAISLFCACLRSTRQLDNIIRQE